MVADTENCDYLIT